MNIQPKSVVSIEYTLKNDAGEVLDKSEGQGPLVYMHGVGNLVPGGVDNRAALLHRRRRPVLVVEPDAALLVELDEERVHGRYEQPHADSNLI